MGPDAMAVASLLPVAGAVAVAAVPGWLAASWLRVPARAGAAFIVATLSLFWCVLLVAGLGAPIRLAPVMAAELGLAALLAGLGLRRLGPGAFLRAMRPARWPGAAAGLGVGSMLPALGGGLVLAVLALRLSVQPLIGYDVTIRWDLVARQVLAVQSLEHYPPQTAADFAWAALPDAMAPVVSLASWWLYAAAGAPDLRLAAAFALAQAVVAGLFVWCFARALGGAGAGPRATAVLAATPLVFVAVGMGQETGLTTIAVLALLFYLHQAGDDWAPGAVVMAALAAALGALAREYGWALLPLAWLLLGMRRAPRRIVLGFSAIVLAVAGPWYLRTWVLTGNPFFPIPLADLLPVNPAYAYFLAEYRRLHGLATFTSAQWRGLGLTLLALAPLQLLALPWIARRPGRRGVGLGAGAALVAILWLASVDLTVGGPQYSLRVLAPAAALLAVAAGVAWDGLRAGTARRLCAIAVGLAIAWAVVVDVLLPHPVTTVAVADWLHRATHRVDFAYRREGLAVVVAAHLPPGVRVLTGNPYEHAALIGSANPAIVIWSPEVGFLFDPSLPAHDMAARLRELGVGAVLALPPGHFDYLARASSFFRADRREWTPLAAIADDSVLYPLPR